MTPKHLIFSLKTKIKKKIAILLGIKKHEIYFNFKKNQTKELKWETFNKYKNQIFLTTESKNKQHE